MYDCPDYTVMEIIYVTPLVILSASKETEEIPAVALTVNSLA